MTARKKPSRRKESLRAGEYLDRLETAFHEAGHFVVSYRLFPTRVRVRLVLRHEGGRLGWSSEESLDELASRRELENEIVVLRAGEVAQVTFNAGARRRARLGAADDYRKIRRLLVAMGETAAKRTAVMKRIENRAVRVVSNSWVQIVAVAFELLRAGELPADLAEAAAEAATGGAVASDAYFSLQGLRG